MEKNHNSGWPKLLRWATNAALFVFLLITGFLLLHKDGALAFDSMAYYLLALCLMLLFLLRFLIQRTSSPQADDGSDSSAKGELR